MIVQLGNPAPVEVIPVDQLDENGDGIVDATGLPVKVDVRRPIDHPDAVTTLKFPDDRSTPEAFIEVTHVNGAWNRHGADHPSWVASDRPLLASLLSEHFGCPVQALAEDEEQV